MHKLELLHNSGGIIYSPHCELCPLELCNENILQDHRYPREILKKN